LVRETVVGRREEYVAVPRAESALNADRMTGYIERPEMVRVCVEELIVRHRCAHCRYEWETAARQQL
jgi:hypothetical protein